MIIESLEKKTRLAMMTVALTIGGCVFICCSVLFWSYTTLHNEREQIYILDGDIPFLAQRAQLESSYEIEAKAHVNMFHQYFFNLPPDNEYIEHSLGKAMYLADGSALKQKQAMTENGFYSDLVSASAVCSVVCDSIKLDRDERSFTYYGTQFIKRRSSQIKRTLVTTGRLQTIPRSNNNPHGLLITNWRTLENKDFKP